MIGQFRFAPLPPCEAIVVDMAWALGSPIGSVSMPDATRLSAIQHHVPLLEPDEPVTLALAVGYAVTIAMLTDQQLCLTGDETAWRSEWGWLTRTT